ncbi:tyrosine-protein phosphatase [Conexibacter woesei]|uniref:protein-tyrosine-phosphatase n=1 Tax=Conexibacter woesei (strain DSM 14684 / CCUG 47730 / CIP 108061 / JCM 11494 / NBRC 100937 / ID131577) TaxID=469383 RepID=D3FFA1_CONWI|nr:CpsB/CapC family capsule biosynthesis tyrosine phosphatase [Conexibacter woesei]ADB53694.1 Protein-tyrosine-phosphatase [Conexibacter woesei DSM 14684]
MIDLHCHLLPAIDDGPADLGGALTLAQAQVDAGIRTVAVTPHVSPAVPTDAAVIERGVEELRVALRAAAIPLEITTGAEIDVRSAAEMDDDGLLRLALGGGPWLLLEAPLTPGLLLEPILSTLLVRGHSVLLAHPERSPVLQRDPTAVRRLVAQGVLMQLTTGGLGGQFGRDVQRFAEQLVDDGLVHNVASDAHNTHRRPPGLREPLERAGLGEHVAAWCQDAPAALLAGELPPAIPPARRRRSDRRGLRSLLGR